MLKSGKVVPQAEAGLSFGCPKKEEGIFILAAIKHPGQEGGCSSFTGHSNENCGYGLLLKEFQPHEFLFFYNCIQG